MREQRRLSISENEAGHIDSDTQNWSPDLKIKSCFAFGHSVSRGFRAGGELGAADSHVFPINS